MKPNLFIAIDFDGTVTDLDITDAIIREFAKPGWEEAERLWEEGGIGSRECLTMQMSLIDTPIERLLEYVSGFAINESFIGFIDFLKEFHIPFGIISDGFQVVIESLLSDAGLSNIPVYANRLVEGDSGLKTIFPYASKSCLSGMCKCKIASELSNGLPIIHIGDGRSDFCLAEKAAYVFSKRKLTDYCRIKGIPHSEFNNFKVIEKSIKMLLKPNLTSESSLISNYKIQSSNFKLHIYHEQIGKELKIWNLAS
jgi:2,3-diketo-5-methylthio-1-phosphopentane phosphatase